MRGPYHYNNVYVIDVPYRYQNNIYKILQLKSCIYKVQYHVYDIYDNNVHTETVLRSALVGNKVDL